ncbi:MAG: histone deacetylase [Spirochaetota bacterium]
MELRVYHHPLCLYHENAPGHPERPERVQSILRRIRTADYALPLSLVEPEPATRAAIERVHSSSYVDRVAASAESDRTVFDADTSANRHSYEAARLAAGGALAATRAAVAGDDAYSFVAMRPPGHHAEHAAAMGFCLFNNVAIAAEEALASGLKRVAIVDWDVHHGNGTEHSFASRSDVLYVSLHQASHYPGTGASSDVGVGDGVGHTINFPLPAGSGEAEYLRCFHEVILPVLHQYDPELLLVSAGFDAHESDPLAGMLLDRNAYEAITDLLRSFADGIAPSRIVHLLEGGYDLEALSDGADAVLSALARGSASSDARVGEAGVSDPRASESPAAREPSTADEQTHDGFDTGYASRLAAAAIEETRSALRDYWSLDRC